LTALGQAQEAETPPEADVTMYTELICCFLHQLIVEHVVKVVLRFDKVARSCQRRASQGAEGPPTEAVAVAPHATQVAMAVDALTIAIRTEEHAPGSSIVANTRLTSNASSMAESNCSCCRRSAAQSDPTIV